MADPVDESCPFVRAPALPIRPHPKAPLLSKGDAALIIKQVIQDLAGGHFSTANESVRQILRQAGLVQLWFFLKYILGAFGPYEKLDSDLHLEMCSFAQSDLCMNPGAMAAVFSFRGTCKTRIFVHGAGTWEITRDPDERLYIVTNTGERGDSIRQTIKRNLTENPLYAWLYPEGVTDINASDIVMPGRSRYQKEPSVGSTGIGSAKAGDHWTSIKWDDIQGLEGLDAAKNVTVVMETARSNFRSNRIPLLDSNATSRTFFVTTFYGPDDVPSTEILPSCKAVYGYTRDTDIKPTPGGQWSIYYRSVVEDGKATCPVVMTREAYEALLQVDPWTALTQYANRPKQAKQGGLGKWKARICRLQRDAEGEWVVIRPGDVNFDLKPTAVRVSEMNLCMAVDPAGTEDNITSQTSRSSVGIWGMDSGANRYRLWQRVGYIGDEELYDSIFEGHEMFAGLIPVTIFETVAMQKVMYKQLLREQEKRKRWLGLIPDPVKSDKVSRIRHTLSQPLSEGLIWLVDGASLEFIEEQNAFPSRKMDVLDESEKAIRYLERPMNETEQREAEDEEVDQRYDASVNAFGY